MTMTPTPDEPKTKKVTRTSLVLLAGACALLGGWLVANGHVHLPGIGGTKTAATKPVAASGAGEDLLAAAVSVTKVERAAFVDQIMVTGTLVAREEILVGPEVEGLRVIAVLADEGQRVKQGDVLARLVTDTLDAQLAQNDAALAKSSAAIAQAGSNIVAAEARQVETQNALDRGTPLRERGVISEATQDSRIAAAATASAQVVAAKDALKVAEADKAQIEALRRDVEWRRARADIRAPADGVVSRRMARIGAYATGAADSMFRIVARGEVELEAEVPETLVGRIKVGDKTTIDVAGARDVTGKVRIVSPEIDKISRLGRVRVFIGDNAQLRVGAFARGLITVAQSTGLSVPSSAVLYDGKVASVQVVKDGKVIARTVELGLATGSNTEIVRGLAEGDEVVSRAGTFLRDGDAVRPISSVQKMTEASK